MFDKETILRNMEALRMPNGAFIAAPTSDYNAVWLRDTLYAAYAYLYLGEHEKLKEGVRVVFEIFSKHRAKIERSLDAYSYRRGAIHAKYNANTLEEITTDDDWGHHQLDALGLFLWIIADLEDRGIHIIHKKEDREIIQMIVDYLSRVKYWKKPDFGFWEEDLIRHSSSIGSVVAGLQRVSDTGIAQVYGLLIAAGKDALAKILPFESRDKCAHKHHNHDCDAAQLSLIWPYNIVSADTAKILLERILQGHISFNAETHKLLQKHGINRYWGDDYYRSQEGRYQGISAEWPMFLFWASIAYSQLNDYETASLWFKKACAQIVDGNIPESYTNGKPNNHTPLAWAHSIALVAHSKLNLE